MNGIMLTIMAASLLLLVNAVEAEKRGYCPAVGLDQVGVCVSNCGNDAGCPGSEKCCFNGCSHLCQRARTSKPGDCPAIDEDKILCIDQINPCATDMDCEGVEKCCWTGCSPFCTKPAPREGICPALATDAVGICITECEEDYDCTSPKKCCRNGCGKTCQTPEIPKPGICPAAEEGMMGICMEGCSMDSECEGDQKCCSNGCGHACKPPANNTCVVLGKHYLPGPVPDPDGCNSCVCFENGMVGCTLMACYPPEIGYMKTVAIVSACLGGLGLIITIIALTGMYFVYKNNNKKKSKVNSMDKLQLVAEADPLPPKA